MSQEIILQVKLIIPDGTSIATPDVDYVQSLHSPPVRDELPPPQATPADVAAQVFPDATFDGCPVHKVAWKTVPAGVAKSTGKPYDSFRACPERGCRERPR